MAQDCQQNEQLQNKTDELIIRMKTAEFGISNDKKEFDIIEETTKNQLETNQLYEAKIT